MLILFFFLIPRLLKRKDAMKPALTEFRLPGSGRTWFAILLVDVSQALQEGTRETACLQIRQQLEVVLHLLCFHLFNEVGGASTCDLSIIVSVESSSPPNLQTLLYLGLKILSRSLRNKAFRNASTNLERRHKSTHRSLVQRDHGSALFNQRFSIKDEMPK
jgi:hypothetical protein